MKRRWIQLLSIIIINIILAVGCGNSAQVRNEAEESDKEIVVAINSDSGGLDPAGNIALTYLAYSVSALDELLTYDENGEIDYRAAESYEVNEDADVWTFHLRKEAVWSDGTPVTAGDFIHTMKRALMPESGSGYANYLYPIKNAEAIYNGEEDAKNLGVTAPDDYTLVFELEDPCVYFLDLLRLPVYTPSYSKYADAADSGWDRNPETSLANGPFYLAEYVPEQYFVLKKNESYWNADEVKLDQITYRFFDSQQAMASAYDTGEVDVATGLLSVVMDLYEGQPDLVITETIATRYIYPNLEVESLDDVRVRKALSLAINREELCEMIGEDTEPTVNLIAKFMKDKNTGNYFVDDATKPFEENVEEAKQLLAEAGYPNGEGFPTLTYNYPSLEMDADAAQVLKEQWKENLNIDIELVAQELQVNYSERKAGNFDLCRMNWTADFADPYTYLSMLLSNGTYNCSGINDAAYDELVVKSNTENDPQKRAALMHEAEQLAVGEEFYVIPLFAMKSCNLIRPEITGIRQVAASGAFEYRYADIEE